MAFKFKSFLLIIFANISCLLIIANSESLVKNEIQEYFFSRNFEAIFLFLAGLAVSNLLLLFFNDQIFKLWLRKIVSWFLPISIIILFAAKASTSEVVSFDRTDYAIVLGCLLVLITLVFSLVQKFYYKR